MGENIQYPPCLWSVLHAKLDAEHNVIKNICITLIRYQKSKKEKQSKIQEIMLKWNEGQTNKLDPAGMPNLIKKASSNFQISCKSLRAVAEFGTIARSRNVSEHRPGRLKT